MTESFQEFWVDEDLGSDHNTIIATFSHQGLTYIIPPKQPKQHKIDHKSTHQEINQYVTTLTNTINENIKENIKKITIQPNKIGLPPIIRELIKEKRKTRKPYQQSRRQHYKTEYNRLNKQIKILIKQEHKRNWENKCNDIELKENQNNTWKQMKSMLGLKPVKTKYPTLITLDNNNK